MKRLISIGSVLLLVLGLAAVARAQILTGSIIGTIKDESGAVLPGVTVTLTSPAHPSGPATFVTSETGEYRFTQLPPGDYTLAITLQGFNGYKEEDLVVTVGGTIERNISLKLGTVEETVTVSGKAPMVDTRAVGTGMNIDREVFENLPTHRQHFAEQIKWTPGVSAGDPSARSDISVMGSNPAENSTLYEGITSETAGGTPFASSDSDAVEEINVATLGSSAEYMRASGGVFTVIYKSGTNKFKFDHATFLKADSLTSKPVLVNCNCPLGQTGFTVMSSRNFSGHVGGPLIKDRLWYFGGGVYNTHIELTPGGNPTLLGDWLWYSHRVVNKVTWQVSDKWRFQQFYQLGPYGGQAVPTLSRPFETLTASYAKIGTQLYASEVTATLSPSTLLTVRATGFDTLRVPTKPLSGDFTSPIHNDSSTGIASGGAASISNPFTWRHGQAVKLNRYLRSSRVEQDVRFGVQLEEAGNVSPGTLIGGVNYSDLGGKPDQATFREPFVSGGQYKSQGGWVEDQMTIAGRLTVVAGVRFDRMHAVSPDVAAVDNQLHETGQTIKGLGDLFTWNVWAPRAGFNLKLTNDTKTILRGNFGRAYRGIYTGEYAAVHPGLSPTTLARWNPATNSYSTIVSVTDPIANIRFDTGIKPPYTDQMSIGLDRELVANVGIGATYVHKSGENQVGWKDIGGTYGSQVAVLPDGRTVTVYPLLSPSSSRLYLRTNGPGTFNRYDGIMLSLNKRMSNRWQAAVSYTYSKAEGLTTTQQDPNGDINAGGRFSFDRPHMLTIVSATEIPKIGVQVAGNFLSQSGTPYAPQALVQLNQGRLSINIEEAGDYRLPHLNLLYLQLTKVVYRNGDRRFLVGANIFNVLQDTAANDVVSRNFYGATFGQPAGWLEPRMLQFQLRFTY